jgi:hypothetical protein
MALYYLDPRQAGTIRTGIGSCPKRRDGQTGVLLAHHVIDGACIHCGQAGTGAAPTVSVSQRDPGSDPRYCYQMLDNGRPGSPLGRFKTESAALAAARAAAGLGARRAARRTYRSTVSIRPMRLLWSWWSDPYKWQWRLCWYCWRLTSVPKRHAFYCKGIKPIG